MIDFDSLTDEQRLDLIEVVLGLLASGDDKEGRAIYLAFQIARRRDGNGPVDDAVRRLEKLAPGWFTGHVLPFAKDTKGLRLPEREMVDA